MTERLTRQQLYDRIRASSKDEVILAEMIRLGFWDAETGKPSLPAAHLKRRGELERELRQLIGRQQALDDPERALQMMRKARLAASRAQREENKHKRIEASHQRSLAWYERRQREVLYLGERVSSELGKRTQDAERLGQQGLGEIAAADAAGLAAAMGIALSELRFLCFHRDVSAVSHYRRFRIPKKTGGERLISAPMPRLKRAQYWVLANILERLPVHAAAHGFVRGRSIVSNAAPHVGRDIVVNFDLDNFFPTLVYARVKGLFRSFGFSAEAATVLALICTEPDRDEVELDGQTLYVAHGERRLPQGAPTSPAIANLVCRALDARLGGAARSLGFEYTRYADDLSFSAAVASAPGLPKLVWRVRQIVPDEGFVVNETKTRIMRRGRRHEVTGVIVNERPGIDRRRLRRFRALLHQVERDGPEGKHFEGRTDNLLDVMHGFASFVHMVDPARGKGLLERVRALGERHALPAPRIPGPLSTAAFKAAAASGNAPREDWWVPVEAPPPVLQLPPEKPSRAASGEPAREQQDSRQAAPARPHIGRNWRLIEAFGIGALIVVALTISPGIAAGIVLYLIVRRLLR